VSFIQGNNIDTNHLYFYGRDSRRLEFNLRKRIKHIDLSEIKSFQKENQSIWVFAGENTEMHFSQQGITVKSVHEFNHLDLNRISPKIFIPSKRNEIFGKRILIEL